MLKNIICIAGLKGSGKDESAKMLQFLLNSPKIFHYYWFYKYFNIFTEGKYKIRRFADTLKEMLAIMLNIPVDNFEKRDFKENYYVNFETLNISHKVVIPKDYILSDSKFSKLIKNTINKVTDKYTLSIRQLLQYFGTEVMRNFFGNKLWILSTFNTSDEYIIISDLRFLIEAEEAKKRNAKIIYIKRPECIVGEHSSEKELETIFKEEKYDFVINNDKSLETLFFNLKTILNYVNCN